MNMNMFHLGIAGLNSNRSSDYSRSFSQGALGGNKNLSNSQSQSQSQCVFKRNLNLIPMRNLNMNNSKCDFYQTNLSNFKNNYNNYTNPNSNRKKKTNLNKFLKNPPFDINQIISSGAEGISELEKNLEVLIYSDFSDKNENESECNEELISLAKSFQVISSYLLNLQTNLESDNNEMEDYYKSLLNDCTYLEQDLKSNKDLIHNYKTTSKDLRYRLNLYKTAIDQNRNPHQDSASLAAYFYCNNGACSGRKFSSYERLQDHFIRRHTKSDINTSNAPVTNSFPANVVNDLMETKMIKLKEELTNSLSNFHKENINCLLENQSNLEKKIEEINRDKQCKQNEFRDIIEEIKKINHNKEEKIIDEESVKLKAIESETKKIHEVIGEMNKEHNQKIYTITEQLVKFRESIVSEIKELKNMPLAKEDDIITTSFTRRSKFKNKNENEVCPCYNIVHSTDIEIKGTKMNENSIKQRDTFKSDAFIEIKAPIIESQNPMPPLELTHKNSNLSYISKDSKVIPDKAIEAPVVIQTEVSDKTEDYEQPDTKPAFESEPHLEYQPPLKIKLTKSDYLTKMKKVFTQFLKREEQQLFLDLDNNNQNISLNKSSYNSIPDLEIVLKSETPAKIKSYLNCSLNKITKNEINAEDLSSYKDLEWKTVTSLISKVSNTSYEKSQKDEYYKDYLENIYKMFNIKKMLSDDKIFSRQKLEEIFKRPNKQEPEVKFIKEVSKNLNSNEEVKNIDSTVNIKQSLESVQTGKFNEGITVNELDDF